MISQDLLSEILNVDCYEVGVSKNIFTYQLVKGCKSEINIYELVHKCKEWAMSKGFIVLTYGEAYYNVDVHYHSNKSKFGNLAFSDTAQEEPEAMFKGCQYILDQIKVLKI
jgi:hypothetical protein